VSPQAERSIGVQTLRWHRGSAKLAEFGLDIVGIAESADDHGLIMCVLTIVKSKTYILFRYKYFGGMAIACR
jgi:hypothetical protein